MRGLLTTKPNNAPQVGQVRNFVIEEREAASGNKWTKIKSEKPEKGGQPYRILSAEKTDYTDGHGNHSFNVELEPAGNAPQTNGTPHSAPSGRGPATHPQREHWKRSLAKAAFLLHKCHVAAEKYGNNDPEDARTLFIYMSRENYVAEMPIVNPETGNIDADEEPL